MKRYSIILMVLFVLTYSASLALAAFNIPSHVFRIDQLQQAKEEAKANNKQIVFLYSNEHTDCPLAAKASINIIERFKRSAVIIYFCKKGWSHVPTIVRKAMNSPEAGKFIPTTVVVDANITGVVSIIPYERP
jgi:ABC-type uncharacterized transport system substrate-binding protein